MVQLFGEIAGELVKALQDVNGVKKQNILAQAPDPDSDEKLPAVYVYSPDFAFEDAGLGGEGGEVKEEAKESLNGDGTRTAFQLDGRPQRPMLRVETPAGEAKIEGPDYTVDYAKGVLTFRSAPPRGRGNIVVRYYSAAGAGKTKQVRLRITYNVEAWAGDEKMADDITVEIIRAVALSQEDLAMKGMQLKPVMGMDLRGERLPSGVFAKRLVYSVETSLEVRIPVERIEKVEVRQLPSEQ